MVLDNGVIFFPIGGFNTYLDQMLESLMRCGYGCAIWTHFFGALAYSIKLNGDNLPWVAKAKHIGNYLHRDCKTDLGMRVKKGICIQRAVELNQEFISLPASLKMRLNLLYNRNWRFEGEDAGHLFSS